jgi:hypothetical protein
VKDDHLCFACADFHSPTFANFI